LPDKSPEYACQKEHSQNLPGGEMGEADVTHTEMIEASPPTPGNGEAIR